MRERTSMKLLYEGPVNLYLLCAVVSKQTRRLGRLMPEERVAELITMAMRSCTDLEFRIQVDAQAPQVIREEAARMFPPAPVPKAAVGSCPDQWDGRETGNAISAIDAQEATDGRQAHGAPDFDEPATGVHISVGNGIDSIDPCRNLYAFQRSYLMNNSQKVDRIRVRQLRAIAENLYLYANRHREQQHYVVALAMYGHALTAAQRIDTPEHSDGGSDLVARIQKDQRAVSEILRANGNGSNRTPLEKAQKVGQ